MKLKSATPAVGLFSFDIQFAYIVAAAYTLIISAAIAIVFPTPPPRFMDVYLIGIALVHKRWSAGPAWLIYFLSLAFAVWILPPRGSVVVSEGFDVYRMVSYSITTLVVIKVIDSLKSRPE